MQPRLNWNDSVSVGHSGHCVSLPPLVVGQSVISSLIMYVSSCISTGLSSNNDFLFATGRKSFKE